MNLTDDEKIALGDFCEMVLNDDRFSFITQQYETSTVQSLLMTKPQDRERRDELYFAVRGVKDLLGLMADLAREKNRLITPETPQLSEDDVSFDLFDVADAEDA